VLKAIAAFVPLRLTDAQERQGADIHSHGEEAYNSEFTS
jgi:ammonia channel protein AmtB